MKDTVRFILKSYFAGLLGALGVLTVLGIVAVVLFGVFGNQIRTLLPASQPILPGNGNQTQVGSGVEEPGGVLMQEIYLPESTPQTEVDLLMEIYLTAEDDPNGDRITSFNKNEAESVTFWVLPPSGITLEFSIMITLPNGDQTEFGPRFTSDPSGQPVNCGKFGNIDPPIGTYQMDVIPSMDSSPAVSVEFTITE